ncbi:MAG: FAD-binding oxidoreductase [Geminicoccaceae bacterium]
MSRGRAVVVGAGVVGTSTAFFLQDDGWQVTLVDPLPPGGGTSSGNAGIISLGSVLPLSSPKLLAELPSVLLDPTGYVAIRWAYLPSLLPFLVRFALAARPSTVARSSEALSSLVSRAGAAHDVLIQRCGLGDLVRTGGWLKVAATKEGMLADTARERAAYDRVGIPYELLNGPEIRELEPALSPDLDGGLLLPMNRAVREPRRYVEGIAASFLARGGTCLSARAQGFSGQGRIAAVVTDKGLLPTDLAVLATGAMGRRLVADAGLRLPLEAERGYHLMLPHPEPTLRRPVYSIDGGFVLAPMEGGVRLTGGVELASPTAPPDYRRVHRLLPIARRIVPGLGETVTSEWQGCRPTLPDSLPVLGPVPGRSNLLLAFGHQHIGLTLGPLTGRLVADMAAGRDPGLDLTSLAPTRRFW